jgi:hypothetical protein
MLAFAALPALLELLPLAASASASGVNSSVIGRIDGINRIDGVNGIDRIDRVNRIVGAVMSHYSPAADAAKSAAKLPAAAPLAIVRRVVVPSRLIVRSVRSSMTLSSVPGHNDDPTLSAWGPREPRR